MRALACGLAGCAWLLAGAAWAEGRPSDEDIFGGGGEAVTTTATATATTTTTTTVTATSTRTATATYTGTTTDSGGGTSTLTSTVTITLTMTGTTTATGTAIAPGTATAPAATTPSGSDKGDVRDELNLGSPDAATRFSSEVAPADPLKIGGQIYWRVMSSGKQGQAPQNWTLSAPALVDVFMDARPNDRVRGFVLGRMFYDPTLPATASSAALASGGGSSAQSQDFLGSATGQQTRGPTVLLDQLWMRADIFHTVFVTAGKQHVRWGTARFWTPTDYLHMVPRNPLLPFDSRTGTTMLKLHMPWEERGWNFYAYALPNGPETASSSTSTFQTGDVAAAARAEVVFGTLEAGAGVFTQRHSKPKLAGDVSFGLWDLDFYGEAALRNASDVDFVSFDQNGIVDMSATGGSPFTNHTSCSTQAGCQPVDLSSTASIVDAYFPVHPGSGWKPQVTGGVSYTRQYADKDTFTVGAEYFYNALGYDDPKVYPAVLFLPHETALRNPATFFYLGRHYLGVYATAPAPYSWDNTTFTLSTLANLSDKSGITRFDYSLTVLTHLRFEAYGAVHWGQRNGEFRFGIDGSALSNTGIPAVDSIAKGIGNIPPAIFDLGVGLRVAL